MKNSERGESVIEIVVAVAIVAMTLSVVLGGSVVAAHAFGADPVTTALQSEVNGEMRVAVNLGKYTGTVFAPASVATTVPMPGSSPLPAHVSVAVSPLPGIGEAISVSAQSDADPRKLASARTVIADPQPVPSSSVTTGVSAAAPIGAQ